MSRVFDPREEQVIGWRLLERISCSLSSSAKVVRVFNPFMTAADDDTRE